MGDLATNVAVASDTMVTGRNHRLQFEFSPEAYSRLQDVKESVGASSYASLVRDALRVYEYVAEQQRRGYEIALRKEGEPLKLVEFITTK